MLKCFGFTFFYQGTCFVLVCFFLLLFFPPKHLILENRSKKRCLNYPLQILKSVLSVILKNWNHSIKTAEKEEVQFWLRKHCLKLKPRKVMEIYCPMVLSCPAFHWASTNFETHLSLCFKDRRAELKHEGQSFAPLFSFGYGKICWNCCIRVITPA